MKRVYKILKSLCILLLAGAWLFAVYSYPSGYWVLLLVLAYIAHAVLFADHIYYPRHSDYLWQVDEKHCQPTTFKDNVLTISDEFKHHQTVLLRVRVKASCSGWVFDPYVTLNSHSQEQRQYFERGAQGIRYINLTPVIEQLEDSEIKLTGSHCSLDQESAELITFPNPDIAGKKCLFIAPHADDSEIAAFGLYRHTDSMIVTITAGEAEPETFSQYISRRSEAARLKGRVRAWDSVAIPKWAGLKEDRVVQLGYFCKHLKRMHGDRASEVTSSYAEISDTRVFREFNTIHLTSDAHGKSSWNQLIADLVEIIDLFKPDCIVTPHPVVDAHEDHQYSTVAVKEAMIESSCPDLQVLYYANHLHDTDMHPFGPSGSLVSLPPLIRKPAVLSGVFSFTLTEQDQKDKIFALEMNHDLRRPVRWKKWLRKRLQQKLIKRYQPDYGEDEFFRKAVRVNELFFY